MDIGRIRLQNMLALMEGYKTQARFADAIDKPPSYISQLKRGMKSNGETISMGSDFARDIEKSLGLKHGWMDVVHSDDAPAQSIQSSDEKHIVIGGRTNYPLVDVQYLDIKASCGDGYANTEHPEAYPQAFTVEFLRANGLPIDGNGLVLMHACSDSMGYTIPHGTLMLVDTRENEFDQFVNNKVYVFKADSEMICKRAMRNLNGTIILKSDNPDKDLYPDQLINRNTFNQFELFGRVRYTFNSL